MQNRQTPFLNQVAVITGGATGIGRAVALALARHGADVMLAGRREAQLAEVAAEVAATGRRADFLATDVTDQDQVNRLVEQTVAKFGRVDLVIANAGQYVRASVLESQVADFERSLAVNFYGALYLIKAALPYLKVQKSGHVVLMSSMDGKKGITPDAPYVAAKFAMAGLGDVLRQELRDDGIGVSVIFPGRVDTPLIDHLEVPKVSAKISPELVADAVVRAIVRRSPEVVLPMQARLLLFVNRLSPYFGDWAVRALHLDGWEKT